MLSKYKTIQTISESLYKDRGSKFLGHAFPLNDVQEVKQIIQNLKEQHTKAVHFCYAYRIGTIGTIYRANDDGEPSGSAGKPILGQIDSFELTNILIVVVRYFGGTLLGVPGLINAYKVASELALNSATIVEKDIVKKIKLSFDYSLLNDVMTLIKQLSLTITKQDLQLFCDIELDIPLQQYEVSINRFKEMYQLQISED